MSLHPDMHAFLIASRLKVIMLPDELDLPPHDYSVTGEQRYELTVGQRYLLLNARRDGVAHVELSSWSNDVRRGAVATFLNTNSNSHFSVSNQQLAIMESEGRFRPDGSIPEPGAAMTLTEGQKAAGTRWLGYVKAIHDSAIKAGKVHKPGKKLINRVAKAHADEIGDAKVPPYNTLKNKYRKFMSGAYDPLVAVAPKISSGNTIKNFPEAVASLLVEAAEETWKLPSGNWRDTRRIFIELLKRPENEFLHGNIFDANGRLKYPESREFQRAKARVPPYMQTYLRYGPELAARVHSVYIKQARPELPLDIVDCDFTKLDIVVFDERAAGVFGRPNIIVFRDRATGSVVGYSVFFDSPSYHAFLSGLRHTMFPKDMSRFPGLSWRQYGLPTAISFDNELVSENMTNAATRLGFQTIEHRPGKPWQKGAMERLFGILNIQAIHNLPGTTMSNPERRKLFDKEKELGLPVLTLEELDAFLTVYFVEFNSTFHSGLGPISTLPGIPDDLWSAGIAKATQRPPIDPYMLVHLAGDSTMKTIQSVGVRWDNLVYASEELFLLRNNPSHVERTTGAESTRYRVYRDPNDVSCIWVVDPYARPQRVIMVPICYEHAAYASGLTLHQHRKYLEEFHRLKRGRAPRDVDELFDIRRTLTPALQELHERRKKHSTAIRLARFFSSIGRKFRHSTIVSMPASEAASAERINFEDPFTARPVDHGSSWSPPPTGANPKKLYRIGTSAMETDDPVRGDLDAWSESASPEIKTPSRFNPDPTDQLEKWSAEHFDPSQFDDEGE